MNIFNRLLVVFLISVTLLFVAKGLVVAATLSVTSVGGTTVGSSVNVNTTDTTPTIIGVASPEATVDISIDDLTVAVLADASGNWSYTPLTALADGAHMLGVASNLETLNYVILVDSGTSESTSSTTTTTTTTTYGIGGATESTQTTLPVAGGIENTFLMVVGGLFLMGLGLVSQQLLPAIQEPKEITVEEPTQQIED
ncbi:MAG: Ig-like domain-containing protein [Patescibacteria group bacterium]